jgi:hypothetical protein
VLGTDGSRVAEYANARTCPFIGATPQWVESRDHTRRPESRVFIPGLAVGTAYRGPGEKGAVQGCLNTDAYVRDVIAVPPEDAVADDGRAAEQHPSTLGCE